MKHALQHLHFIGVGGSGMSGIAEIVHRQGFTVSGSDAVASETTERLATLGLRIHIGHAVGQVAGAQVVVASTAVQAHNPEVQAARERGVPVVSRATVLAELMRTRQGIAIAGTHGKTTTTSLVASVLMAAGVDPSFVIGGQLASAGSNARLGQGEFMVVEADESDASFLSLPPVMAVVTNIDQDHMDTYGHSEAKLREAFVQFLHRMPFYGAAVLCWEDEGVRAVASQVQRPVLRYGFEDAQQGPICHLRAAQVQALAGGRMHFVVKRRARISNAGAAGGSDLGAELPDLPITLNLAGRHNVLNALAAIGVAMELKLPDAAVQSALANFSGVGRRFTRHGLLPCLGGGQFELIDDYGHHPVEMAAVLAAARGAFPGQRLVLAFQPHRYTRTRDCLQDFAKVMAQFDAVVLSEVYAAGEAPIAGADGQALMAALHLANQARPVAAAAAVVLPETVFEAEFVSDLSRLPSCLKQMLRAGDVLITMGAGSIGQVPQQLKALAASPSPQTLGAAA